MFDTHMAFETGDAGLVIVPPDIEARLASDHMTFAGDQYHRYSVPKVGNYLRTAGEQFNLMAIHIGIHGNARLGVQLKGKALRKIDGDRKSTRLNSSH